MVIDPIRAIHGHTCKHCGMQNQEITTAGNVHGHFVTIVSERKCMVETQENKSKHD